VSLLLFSDFYFTPSSTTPTHTLSLHDALPISFGFASTQFDQQVTTLDLLHLGDGHPAHHSPARRGDGGLHLHGLDGRDGIAGGEDRKSTRLNSSHVKISYAVICLKKKTSDALE